MTSGYSLSFSDSNSIASICGFFELRLPMVLKISSWISLKVETPVKDVLWLVQKSNKVVLLAAESGLNQKAITFTWYFSGSLLCAEFSRTGSRWWPCGSRQSSRWQRTCPEPRWGWCIQHPRQVSQGLVGVGKTSGDLSRTVWSTCPSWSPVVMNWLGNAWKQNQQFRDSTKKCGS